MTDLTRIVQPTIAGLMRSLKREAARGSSQPPGFEPVVEAPKAFDPALPYVNAILHFAECRQTGKAPLTSGHDNLNTMKVIFGIYQPADTGTRADLKDL